MNREEMCRWCRIPAEQLVNHPESKIQLKVYDDKNEVSVVTGNMMAEEVIENNKAGKPTKWILPAGPMGQYRYFADRVNTERISLKNVYVFHMDDFLDWQGRPFPEIDNYYSLKANMINGFYGLIDEELNIPEENRFFPSIYDIDAIDKKIEELGGVDTVYGGLGYRGLVAFCEAPDSSYYDITVEEYANSKTRIVHLNADTLISLSERDIGGFVQIVPPMAVTIGFKSMLSAKKAVFMVTTGSWKQTSVRVLMFSEPTVEYPATLFPKYVPKVIVLADTNTTQPPLTDEIYAEDGK
ncbi:glucosamine-6-phosphate isomerase [Lachnospiraceae bacterium]|jgi:6-phosphogluconolactonase/Glucosamine-6-phosphate isomerase/deaminase|nr:glucosamine-6-phosphate isomerase [uncultured Schaedlerella sp.]MCI8766270.1 glucosamine-6-phosphate isomerase [Ruminococcus sp.]NBI99807.1 glucosamine-6-phosphate isomerase [Lachnospiraceae bacterium]